MPVGFQRSPSPRLAVPRNATAPLVWFLVGNDLQVLLDAIHSRVNSSPFLGVGPQKQIRDDDCPAEAGEKQNRFSNKCETDVVCHTQYSDGFGPKLPPKKQKTGEKITGLSAYFGGLL